jgi:hypothetical protein
MMIPTYGIIQPQSKKKIKIMITSSIVKKLLEIYFKKINKNIIFLYSK